MKPAEAVKVLAKRLAHLEQRIASSDKDLSYDKAEAAALKVAIDAIQVRLAQLATPAS